MMELFVSGGFFVWPLLVTGMVVLGLSANAVRKLFAAVDAEDEEIRSGIDAILFWGGFAAVLGVLGTLGGLAQMAQAIERLGDVGAALVWGGIRLALITSLLGFAILLLSLLLWLALRATQRRRRAA
jgi:biopolymer transport protein ExbB/TolQ